MPGIESTHTLLATLGGQPQVVTFTLDLLLQRHIPIREVIVVHPASYDQLEQSIARLDAEFPADCYRATGQPMRLRRHVLRQYNQPIDDIVDELTADGVLNAMDELISDLKRQQRTLHFSITGGRRLVGYLSFSAALLNFGPADRLWHIHTPGAVKLRARNGALMHVAAEDGVRLIEVPFARLTQPILSRLLSSEPGNARKIIDEQATQEVAERHRLCRIVVEKVKPAQIKVLRAIASGLHPHEVALQLKRQAATVSSHTTILMRECRNAWNIPEGKHIDYHFLQSMFADYFPDEA